MFGRDGKTATPAPSPSPSPSPSPPADTSDLKECKGRILYKTPYLSGAYTYFTVAILVELPDGGKEAVLEHSGSGASNPLALCQPGHRVKVSMYRNSPDRPWTVRCFDIVYNIELEKLAVAKLNL